MTYTMQDDLGFHHEHSLPFGMSLLAISTDGNRMVLTIRDDQQTIVRLFITHDGVVISSIQDFSPRNPSRRTALD